MKKRLFVVIAATVILLAALVLLNLWIENRWGIEQSSRVGPFKNAAICFLTPLGLSLAHRWRRTHEPVSPGREKTMSRFVVFLQIGFFLFGLGNVATGLSAFSVLPSELAFLLFTGFSGLGLLAMFAAIIVVLRPQRSVKSIQAQMDRPEA